MSTAPRQTEAQRLADELTRLANLEANELADCMNDVAALLLRQDELLGQALEAMEEAHDQSLDGMHLKCRQTLLAQISSIRAHREAK